MTFISNFDTNNNLIVYTPNLSTEVELQEKNISDKNSIYYIINNRQDLKTTTAFLKIYNLLRVINKIFVSVVDKVNNEFRFNSNLIKLELFFYSHYNKLPFIIHIALYFLRLRVCPTFIYLEDNVLLAPYPLMIGGADIEGPKFIITEINEVRARQLASMAKKASLQHAATSTSMTQSISQSKATDIFDNISSTQSHLSTNRSQSSSSSTIPTLPSQQSQSLSSSSSSTTTLQPQRDIQIMSDIIDPMINSRIQQGNIPVRDTTSFTATFKRGSSGVVPLTIIQSGRQLARIPSQVLDVSPQPVYPLTPLTYRSPLQLSYHTSEQEQLISNSTTSSGRNNSGIGFCKDRCC